jgi:HSP20 family protein
MEDKELSIENKIKELRKRRQLSQEELAEALGISRQSIIALEQGRTMPSLPLAVSLCQFFDSAFEEMFEFENEIHREMDKAFSDSHIRINVINPGEKPEGKERAMTDLSPWRPFREAVSLRDAMDRLFEDSVITPGKSVGMPKIDIKDLKGKIVVKAELPGISEDEINVEILDSIMTISGEKKEEKEKEEEGYFYKESHSGSFSRSFNLPSDVMGEKAEASMDKGVLTVTIPKIEPKKAKKIEVKKK